MYLKCTGILKVYWTTHVDSLEDFNFKPLLSSSFEGWIRVEAYKGLM